MAKTDGDWQRYIRALRNMSLSDPEKRKPGVSEFGVGFGDCGYETPARADGTRYRPQGASQSLRRRK